MRPRCFSRFFLPALLLSNLSALPAYSLDGGSSFDVVVKPVGVTEVNCNFNPYYDPFGQEAQVNFSFGSSGGNYWFGGAVQPWGAGDIQASDVAARCNIANITNFVSDGANGDYASDDFVGVSFTGQYQGLWHDYKIGIQGVTNTHFVNSRTNIAPPNTPPTANAGGDQLSIATGALVTLDGAASDANDAGQVLTYSWAQVAGIAVSLSGETTVNPTFTAPSVPIAGAETLVFELVVHDGVEASLADEVSVTVNGPPNTTPSANAGMDQTVVSGLTVTLDGSGSSANDPGQVLTYAWQQTSGIGVTLSDGTQQRPTFTAPVVPIGGSETLTFRLIVNDGLHDSVLDVVSVTVNGPVNTVPTAVADSPILIASGASGMLSSLGSDANDAGQVLTYSWTQVSGPSVTSFDGTTANPTFVAPTILPGGSQNITFRLVVHDGIENSAPVETTTTVVAPPNTPPSANAGSDQNVATGAAVILDGSGSSANDAGQVLTYAWQQTSGTGVTLSDGTQQSPTFTAPVVPVGGSVDLTFRLIVNDGIEDSPLDTVVITVQGAPNTPATANAGSPQTVASAASVTLDGSGSDANDLGQVLTYAWQQTGGVGVTLSDGTQQSPTFIAPAVPVGGSEVLTFTLVVNDGFGSSAPSTVAITVNGAANTAPTADAGSAQAVASAAMVTLDGSGSDANDPGQILTYSWSQTGGPGVTLSDTTVANPAFTAPVVTVNNTEVLTFSLIVNDGIEGSGAATVMVTVNGPVDLTRPMVALSGAPASHDGSTGFTVNVNFSEPVSGFVLGDLDVQNGSVSGFSGSGAAYSVEITPTDQTQTVSVQVPENVATDTAGNGNEMSVVLAVAGTNVEMAQEEIRSFMSQRAGLLTRAQPNLSRFLKSGRGVLNGNATASRGNLDFSTGHGARFWADVTALWSREDGDRQSYAHLAFGSHFTATENLVIGAMAQFDRVDGSNGMRDIESTGYLFGPYFAARLANQPLIFSGSLLHGRSESELTLTGLPADRFDNTRTLATLGVEGSVALKNGMTLIPSLDVSYLRDRQHAYTNGAGSVVPEQVLKQTSATLGLDLEIPLSLETMEIVLTPGIHARFSDTDDGVLPTHSSSAGLEFGGLFSLSERSSVSVDLFYDGIGDSSSETWGGRVFYELKF